MAENVSYSQIAVKLLAFVIGLICLAVLGVSVAQTGNKIIPTKSSNDPITWGFKKYKDVLIIRHVIVKPKSWFSSKTTNVTWRYPENGELDRKISAIYFYEAPKGRANPKLLSGGVGRNFTQIQLTPQRGQGVNVTVILYGPPRRKVPSATERLRNDRNVTSYDITLY